MKKLKTGDPIWILRNSSNDKRIETSVIKAVGSKWAYFGHSEKFEIQSMKTKHYAGWSDRVFLSQEALDHDIKKKNLVYDIYKLVSIHKFKADNYSLETLIQIKNLLELKDSKEND